MTQALVDQVRALARSVEALYRGSPQEQGAHAIAARLDEPLRVAIAGKVKAGKSTLLNALVGEELAPTDASECTKIVTWYREAVTYRTLVYPVDSEPVQVPFTRDAGQVEVDLQGRKIEEIERLVVEWPASSLHSMTLIDTPGIGSLSTGVSARTHDFLAPEDDRATQADAVLYLMRHLHSTDVRFLEAFHDEEVAQATPINAIGVLSRADEIGVGRPDAMTSAARIAERYRGDPSIRRLCQTVVPVAGLLAQTGQTLREVEFTALGRIASAPIAESDSLLMTADRFVKPETTVDLIPMERQVLLERFGLFGLRLSVALIRQGAATTAPALARALVESSGLDELRSVLSSQFSARRDVLKSRSALLEIEALLRGAPVPGSDALAAEAERVEAGAHAFTELRLQNALRTGGVSFKPEEVANAERLIGGSGDAPAARLGLAPDASEDDIRRTAMEVMSRWQVRAESPMSSRDVVDAARALVRTCEGILAGLSSAQS